MEQDIIKFVVSDGNTFLFISPSLDTNPTLIDNIIDDIESLAAMPMGDRQRFIKEN